MANYNLIRDPKTPNLTASTSETVIITGSHNFEIKGFSSTKGIGVGKYISSDTFSVGGHLWEINFYPDGYGKVDENGQVHVSCYIALVSDFKNQRIFLDCALLDQRRNEWYNRASNFQSMCKAGIYTTTSITLKECSNVKCGYLNFYKRTELEASQFIRDDCLTIQCSVGVVKTSMDVPKAFAQPLPLSELGQSYGQLFESREGSDVSFEVEGETFYAHKLILSTRSPVFKAQFFGPLKDDNTRCIKIEDMHAPVFKALLHFIYCDVIPDVGDDFEGLDSKCVATIMTQHLLAAADRYGIERLRTLCEERLCENIVVNTVASTLALAEQHGYLQLKLKCIEFIFLPENIKAVMQTDGFKNLKESCPSVVAELLQSLVLRVDPKRFSNKLGCGCFSSALRWCLL